MIYFDNSATTALCPEAQEGVLRAIKCFANPSSLHDFGLEAQNIREEARANILSALGARKDAYTVVFTSGGTEANNLAIRGCAKAKKYKNPKIITTDSEHPCVINPSAELEADGFRVVRIATKNGELDMEQLEREADPDTVLVSLMLVNNETGALYDTKKAFSIAKKKNPSVITHTDAVQGFMKVPFSPKSIGADMVTLSSHKIHGPKGSGALVVANSLLSSHRIAPIILGGGQEGDLRSGTENMIGISGFGAAAKAMAERFDSDFAKMNDLREYLIANMPTDITVNSPAAHAPHIISATLPSIRSETMLHFLSSKDICVSSGSACSSHDHAHGPYVLLSYGLDRKRADSTIRISLCAENSREEADALIAALNEGLSTLIRSK